MFFTDVNVVKMELAVCGFFIVMHLNLKMNELVVLDVENHLAFSNKHF